MRHRTRGWNPCQLVALAFGLIILLLGILPSRVLGWGGPPPAAWLDLALLG